MQSNVLYPLHVTACIKNICRFFNMGKTYLYADNLKAIYKTDICDVRSTM